MRRGITAAARAGLIGLSLLMAGCGWFRGDDELVIESLPELTWAPVTRAAAVYDIYSVTPNVGPLAGGQQVLLDGNFPAISNAETIYTVYFGANAANYDTAFSPFFTDQNIRVVTPPGDALGLVDVILRDTLAALDTAAAYYGYEYLDPFDLIAVDPNQGPLSGGTPVELIGRFPIAVNLSTVAEANSAYSVYFGANLAGFDPLFDPVITSERMYVITPRGDMPGFVDVSVEIIGTDPLDFRFITDGFEYIDPFDLIAVDPNQGPLSGGTPVELIGRFPIAVNLSTVAEANSAYSVYFGANLAGFDPLFDPVITSERMYVITPRGDVPGFVDVSVEIIGTDPLDFRFITDGFEYIDDFAIIDVIPDMGPLAGGQQVEIIGRFPIAESISTIDQAYSAYNVYFGANLAGFDAAFDPVITSERMYVITPPGDMAGLVDVTVFDVLSLPLDRRVLLDGYEYVADIELTGVDPDNGFILGDPVSPIFNFVNTSVTLTGTFPVPVDITSLALAEEHYTVYFGPRRVDRIARFDDDPLLPAIITANQMYVLAPVGEDIGPVDVRVEVNRLPSVFAELERAYRYYSMYIGAIIPNFGPQAGGNPVEIQGLFLADPVFTDAVDEGVDPLIAAEQIYSVFFDSNQAFFDSSEIPPITFASIDTINRVYVANRLYVAAPPGDAPGFVDVIVFSDLDREPPAVSDPLKYEYTDDFGIGQWISATVQPNPVGKLPPGHLLVTIVIDGTISDNTAEIFIVPQGGNPANTNHRIELEMIGVESGDGNNSVWTGTNVNLIDTVTGPEAILTDGHAAIFIHEFETDTIVGGPADDGRIEPAAEEGRHFIIDTIPPRMLIDNEINGDRGDFFFDPPPAINSDVFTTVIADIPASPLHPFPLPPAGIITTEEIPWDQSGLRRNQVDRNNDGFDDFTGQALFDPGTNRAQIFYNTGSIANNFAMDDLRFSLSVTFEDVDVYTTLGLTPDLVTDEDAFNPGVTARQVAGFELAPTVPPVGDRDDGVIGDGDDVLVKWDISGGASSSPDVFNITTTYDTREPEDIDTGDISPNLAPANTVLDVSWEANGGIEWADQNLLMPIVFRGVDRAGNYFPRGDTSQGKKKLWTLPPWTVVFPTSSIIFDQTTGPLNLWWLVNTGTEFIETNIPASENTRNPNFRWQNTSHPDPDTIPDPDRLFSYRLWNTDGTAAREDARAGPYTALGGWNGWFAKDFLTASEMQADIEASEGAWMLLVVIAADEAGNVEQWPLSDLGDISGDPQITVASNAGSNGNWRRWYVAPAEEVVDTEVRPTFWHDFGIPGDGVINPGENVLGNIEIVPLSPRNDESVSVTFRVDVIPDPSIAISTGLDPITIEFTLEGPPSTSTFTRVGPRTFTVTYVDLGDRITRRPVHYVFRAAGRVTDTGDPPPIVDSTPANFKFVVVDNVAEFIEGRGDDQPIKEQDRP